MLIIRSSHNHPNLRLEELMAKFLHSSSWIWPPVNLALHLQLHVDQLPKGWYHRCAYYRIEWWKHLRIQQCIPLLIKSQMLWLASRLIIRPNNKIHSIKIASIHWSSTSIPVITTEDLLPWMFHRYINSQPDASEFSIRGTNIIADDPYQKKTL